jgi:hypothetical protein
MKDHDNPYLYALTADPNKPLREALETVARLTQELHTMTELHRNQRLRMTALYEEQERLQGMVKMLDDSVNRIVTERDDARRMYCRLMADSLLHYSEPERIALDRGWNCFIKDAK